MNYQLAVLLAETQLTLSVGLVALFVIAGALAACFQKIVPAVLCLSVAILLLVLR